MRKGRGQWRQKELEFGEGGKIGKAKTKQTTTKKGIGSTLILQKRGGW